MSAMWVAAAGRSRSRVDSTLRTSPRKWLTMPLLDASAMLWQVVVPPSRARISMNRTIAGTTSACRPSTPIGPEMNWWYCGVDRPLHWSRFVNGLGTVHSDKMS